MSEVDPSLTLRKEKRPVDVFRACLRAPSASMPRTGDPSLTLRKEKRPVDVFRACLRVLSASMPRTGDPSLTLRMTGSCVWCHSCAWCHSERSEESSPFPHLVIHILFYHLEHDIRIYRIELRSFSLFYFFSDFLL